MHENTDEKTVSEELFSINIFKNLFYFPQKEKEHFENPVISI